MERKVDLGNGYAATVWWDVVDDEWVVTAVSLQHGSVVLGVLQRDYRGDLVAPGYWDWYGSDQEQDEAEQYYRTKYPDLANESRQNVFEEGFCREEERLGDTLERADELADTLNQPGKGPFLLVDAEGQILSYDEDVLELVESVMRQRPGIWVSPDHADERTLMIAPIGRLRVQAAP
jgi:hypothetical protein